MDQKSLSIFFLSSSAVVAYMVEVATWWRGPQVSWGPLVHDFWGSTAPSPVPDSLKDVLFHQCFPWDRTTAHP
jgi:hypothetical protein